MTDDQKEDMAKFVARQIHLVANEDFSIEDMREVMRMDDRVKKIPSLRDAMDILSRVNDRLQERMEEDGYVENRLEELGYM